MKTIIAFVGLIALVWATCVYGQASPVYNALSPNPTAQYFPPGAMPVRPAPVPSGPVQSGPEVYDHSYQGPYNAYGQPVLSGPTRQQQSVYGSQLPPGADGAIPQAMQGLSYLGDYFWSYLPAPLRGVEDSPYLAGPQAGQTSVLFVPGYR